MNSKELSQKEAELILEKQNEYFNSQATKDVDFRIAQLKLLKSLSLVQGQRQGKLIFYSLSSDKVNQIMLSGVEHLQSNRLI